jgi:hypothetical protein
VKPPRPRGPPLSPNGTSAMRSLLALLLLTGSANATITVWEFPYNQVHTECGGAPQQLHLHRTIACAYPKMRLIILPFIQSVGQRKYSCLLKHEMEHVNGWPASHEGGPTAKEC